MDGHNVRLTMVEDGRRRVIRWGELGHHDFANFGLVLGAGGATGAAFEVGILLALAVDHGVRLADAGTVIGTSAGAIAASLLTLGFEAEDIAALITESRVHLSPRAARHGVQLVGDVPPLPPLRAIFRVPTPQRAVGTARMLLARRFSSSLLPLLRTGTFDLSPHLGFLTNAEWPTAPRHLKICAADLGSGARLVFDGSTDVRLSQAVAASCAVPSVMSPVNAAGRLCVDGAIISPTNADLLIDEKAAPDLALVISPMSGRQARTMAGAMSARFAARRLAGELRRFRSGQRIIVVEPASRLSELVLDEALSSSRSRHILSSAFVGASA